MVHRIQLLPTDALADRSFAAEHRFQTKRTKYFVQITS
ncbi:hypothetical protein BSM4216_1559 [Bacillus smithii]|nr:hypothetical protein BSM4216_1559 [Bacillus smithii]